MRDVDRIERPREKLATRGAAALSDLELLAVLLGSGTPRRGVLDLAANVLRHVGGRLENVDVDSLEAVEGIGRARACQIVAALELARRHSGRRRLVVREAEDVLPYLRNIRRQRQEVFVCLSLNGANEVIESRTVTIGLLDTTQVHPREVFSDPLVDRAAAVIFAHNHPSGTLEPSPEDLALTKRLVHAGELLGIRVLDHLIVTDDGHLSLKQAGHM
jgi:DNA repair protein RadC